MRATLSFLAVFVIFSSYILHAQKELSPAWTSHYIGSSMEYSEDETTFITFTEKGVTLWDAKTLTALGTFAEFGSDKEYGRKIISATLSSDGTRLVTGNSDGTVRIWSTMNGNVLKTINVSPFSEPPYNRYDAYVREVHINKQNNRIIIRTKSGSECSLWDIEAERKLNSYESCSLIKFSKQGNLILGLFRDTVLYVCSSNTGESIVRKTMPNHIRHIEYAEFDSTDNRIITVNRSINSSSYSGEKNVILWSTEDLTEIQSNKVIVDNPYGFRIRYYATGSKVSIITSYIYMYDIVENSWIMNKYTPKNNAYIVSVNYNADKIAYMDSISMVIYSISKDKQIFSMKRNPRISYFSLNKSGDKMIGTSHFGVLHMYNTVDGKSDVLMGHTDRVLHATFNEQNNLFATDGGRCAPKIWNIDGSPNNYVDNGNAKDTKYISFNLNSNRLITFNGWGKFVWDLEQETLKYSQGLGIVLMGAYNRWHNKSIALVRNQDAVKMYYVNSIYFSTEQGFDITGGEHPKPEVPPQYNYVTLSNSTNYVAATKYNNELIIKNVWNDTESIIRTPYNNRSVVFSNDEKRILVGHETGEITVWDVLTKNKVLEIEADPRWLKSAVFTTQDSKIMTVGHDSTAKLWDAETGVLLQAFSTRKNFISLAQIDRTGRHIVLCDYASSTPTVWDANSGKLIARLVGHSDTVLYVTFDNSGSKVVTTSADGTVKMWDLEQAITQATTSVHDNSENVEAGAVEIYPNPTDNEITINYPFQYITSEYSIINQFGENLALGFIPKGNNRHTISLGDLPSGIYFFSTEINGKKIQHRFVIIR